MKQYKEPSLVEFVKGNEDIFSNCEVSHNSDCNEHSIEVNNIGTTSPDEFTDGLSPCINEQKASFASNSSHAQSEKNLWKTLKQVLKEKVSPLET